MSIEGTVEIQVCNSFKEDLRDDGKKDEDLCVLCQDKTVLCRVGNHMNKKG